MNSHCGIAMILDTTFLTHRLSSIINIAPLINSESMKLALSQTLCKWRAFANLTPSACQNDLDRLRCFKERLFIKFNCSGWIRLISSTKRKGKFLHSGDFINHLAKSSRQGASLETNRRSLTC